MQSYKELIVWQKSFLLTLLVYKLTKMFPKDEVYGLSSQMRRAAVSIPSNIAEGYARKSKKDYCNFIRTAFASGAELETQLLIAKSPGYLSEDNFIEVMNLLTEVMKMLYRLKEKLEQ
jgi:four helix bundle protein